jgi:hypothetical protein
MISMLGILIPLILKINSGYWRVWYRLFLKMFFTWKYIKIIYIFLKIIFNITTLKQFESTKKY